MNPGQPEMQRQEGEIVLLDYFVVFFKRKRLVFLGTFAFVVLALAICFVLTPNYEGDVLIMPPQQNSSSMAAQFLGQMGGAAAGLLQAGGLTTTTGDLYVGIIQSEAILDAIIDRFDLQKFYNLDTRIETRKFVTDYLMQANTDTKSGIVSVSVLDPNAQKAADMANAFVQELQKLLENISDTDTKKRRLFLEKEMKRSFELLSEAENALKAFEEKTGVLKVDDQASAVLNQIVALKAQVAAQEIQIRVMQTYATPYNYDLKKAVEQLSGLRGELRKLEEKQEGAGPNVIIPTEQIPDLGTEYIRKIRDFKFNEMLYELLIKQYEAARLEEASDTINVDIISRATPGDRKAAPKILLVVLLLGALGFFILALVAFIVEFVETSSTKPEFRVRVNQIGTYLKRI
jgi:tyrosine-protein kinase Etk/Wzc